MANNHIYSCRQQACAARPCHDWLSGGLPVSPLRVMATPQPREKQRIFAALATYDSDGAMSRHSTGQGLALDRHPVRFVVGIQRCFHILRYLHRQRAEIARPRSRPLPGVDTYLRRLGFEQVEHGPCMIDRVLQGRQSLIIVTLNTGLPPATERFFVSVIGIRQPVVYLHGEKVEGDDLFWRGVVDITLPVLVFQPGSDKVDHGPGAEHRDRQVIKI